MILSSLRVFSLDSGFRFSVEMDRFQRASSKTKLLLLIVQIVITILTITDTIYADPKSKSIDFQSSLEEIHRGEDDDNAVIVDGKWMIS